jgi:hypothetical protein
MSEVAEAFDARLWTRAWLKTVAGRPTLHLDEIAMIGWFSNVLLAGYTEGLRSAGARADRLRAALVAVVGASDTEELKQMRTAINGVGADEDLLASRLAIQALIDDNGGS